MGKVMVMEHGPSKKPSKVRMTRKDITKQQKQQQK